eukprot:74023_1
MGNTNSNASTNAPPTKDDQKAPDKISLATQEYIYKSIDKENNKITCLDSDFNDITFDLDTQNQELLAKIDKTIEDGQKQKKDVKICVSAFRKDSTETQTVSDIKIVSTDEKTELKPKQNVKVSIQFKVVVVVLKKFPQNVEVISKKDPGVTGNFEISVNGQLIHSKKTQKHGFLHTNKQQQGAVFAAISQSL